MPSPLRLPPNILQDVWAVLDVGGITFGTLIVNALQDKTEALAASVVMELPNILEALRPHFDADEGARVLLGRFFASVAAPELLSFGKDDISFNIPAVNLSAEQLMGFNLGDMWKRIGLGAPALLSFLTSICGGSKTGRCETDDRMDVGQMGDCEGAEDEMESDDDDVEDSEPWPGQTSGKGEKPYKGL